MEEYFFSSVTDVMILPVAFLSGEILKCVQKNQKMEVFFTVSCKLKKKNNWAEISPKYFKKERNIFMLCLAQAF